MDNLAAKAQASDDDNTLQRSVVSLYKKLLQTEAIDENSGFYQSGGTSLSATLLMVELLSQHGIQVSFDEFERNNTPASLCRSVSARRSDAQLPRLERRASHERQEFWLSTAQRSRCWYLGAFRAERAGDDGMYNSGYASWLLGRIDLECLERAFNLAARQHDALSMSFTATDGRVVQAYKGARPVEFRAEPAPPAVREAYLAGGPSQQDLRIGDESVVHEFIHRPFDWAKGETLRCLVYTIDEAACLLLLSGNHVALDFLSRGVLLKDVASIYNGLIDGQPRVAKALAQYRDYLEWERQYLDSFAYESHLSYWIKYLSGSEQEVGLPVATPRPAARARDELYHQDKECLELDGSLLAQVKEAAQAASVTRYVVLFSAFALTLAKLSRQGRLTIGTQLANRRQAEVLDICGCFAQPVAIACELSPQDTPETLFLGVQRDLMAAIEHQPVSLPAIVEAMQRDGGERLHPLYQCSFEYFDAQAPALALAGVEARELFIPYHFGRTSNELTLLLSERAQGISGVLLYARELYTPPMIKALMAEYVTSLQALLDAPRAAMRELAPELFSVRQAS